MIEFSYDEGIRACYITLDGSSDDALGKNHGHTKVISEDPMVNLDYRKDGSLYGIEILLPDKGEEK